MAGIGTIVSIRRSDEYGGKYAGKLGIVKKLADNRVGVEFSDLKNPASGYGLFWFKKENVNLRSLIHRNITMQSFRRLLLRLSSTSLSEHPEHRSA